jgi:hypothetical protein
VLSAQQLIETEIVPVAHRRRRVGHRDQPCLRNAGGSPACSLDGWYLAGMITPL